MFKEFKEFALKGNVMDLAVAVIIGAAFGKIVTSLVEDIIMPVVGNAHRRPRLHQHVSPALEQSPDGPGFSRRAEARCRSRVGQLCHDRDQLRHRLVLHFPHRESAQQHEEAARRSAGDHEGLPRLHDDDSSQGDTLPALHDGVGGRLSRARLVRRCGYAAGAAECVAACRATCEHLPVRRPMPRPPAHGRKRRQNPAAGPAGRTPGSFRRKPAPSRDRCRPDDDGR